MDFVIIRIYALDIVFDEMINDKMQAFKTAEKG